MNRTAAGLVAVARRLTGPMPGIHHSVGQSPRRFATRAFERLGGDCHDLDTLERALDRLPGLPGAEESTGSRDLRRRRAPHRAAAAPNGAGAAPTGNGRVASSDRVAAGQLRTHGEGLRGFPDSASPLWPEPSRSVASTPRAGSPIDLPDGHRPQPAGAGPRPGEGTDASRDPASLPARASEVGPGGSESESRPPPPADSITPIPPGRAAPAGSARADRPIADGVAHPADEGAAAVPADFSGALGDLLRRSGVRELPSTAALAPTNSDTVWPPRPTSSDVTSLSGVPRAAIGVPTAAVVVEAFEMAMDELVRREAERHGLESEL